MERLGSLVAVAIVVSVVGYGWYTYVYAPFESASQTVRDHPPGAMPHDSPPQYPNYSSQTFTPPDSTYIPPTYTGQ